jgi:hypothetical protein
LNIIFGIKNERQDCKIGSLLGGGGILVEGRRVNGGDEDEGIQLMGFTYIYIHIYISYIHSCIYYSYISYIYLHIYMKLLAIVLSGAGKRRWRVQSNQCTM